MSATEALPAAAAGTPRRPAFAGRVTQGHVLRSEWTKLWSLRSTRWSLLFAVSLGHPHALRTLVGVVLFMTITGILCVALGTIIRSTAGAIATFAGLLFVLPGIVDILPSEIGNSINAYLPSSAGGAIARVVPDPHTLSPWGGFALYCGYTIVLLAVAAYMLVHRDA
jgi:hypothetical protein